MSFHVISKCMSRNSMKTQSPRTFWYMKRYPACGIFGHENLPQALPSRLDYRRGWRVHERKTVVRGLHRDALIESMYRVPVSSNSAHSK